MAERLKETNAEIEGLKDLVRNVKRDTEKTVEEIDTRTVQIENATGKTVSTLESRIAKQDGLIERQARELTDLKGELDKLKKKKKKKNKKKNKNNKNKQKPYLCKKYCLFVCCLTTHQP